MSTQEEIIEMAKEAGWEVDDSLAFEPTVIWYLDQDQLGTFARLVAAKEREACALICAQRAKDFEDLLKKYGHEHDDGARVGASQCEQMIRARGNT